MATRREFELHILRFLPHPLRDDFVTVGLLLLESDSGLAEFRFTCDWTLLRCIAPHVELEWFEMVENDIRARLGNLRKREDFVQLVNERFGTMFDVAPTKAVQTEDPAREIETLTSIYLSPMDRIERVTCSGRMAIVSTIRQEFSKAGVWELIRKDLDVEKYTGQGDPFRVDFGYQIGGVVKLFHAVSVASNVDQALALLYRYSRVTAGMQQEQLQVCLTAVVDEKSALEEEKAQFAIGVLKQSSVRVRPVGRLGEIVGEVRQDAVGLGLVGKSHTGKAVWRLRSDDSSGGTMT
jgi:hypothetical protein